MDKNHETDAIGFSKWKPSTTREINKGPLPFSNAYSMNHSIRGTVVIFNHETFDNKRLNKRTGTNKDRDDLEKLFESLKFNVKVYNNLNRDGVLSVLYEESKFNHSDADCFILIVLSHGDTGIIYAKDDSYRSENLWKYFDGKSSPSLIGKPKLFFIQACRGENVDLGVRLVGAEVDSVDSKDYRLYSLPTTADMLIMYSTVDDFLSWRIPRDGSYFIQSLVRQMSTHAADKDLLSILTCVNREVAIGFSAEMIEEHVSQYRRKQMPSFVSTLTRDLYFR